MLDLDLTNTPEAGACIPEGTYFILADDAEIKPTKTGDGEYIRIKYRVLEGPHEGRVLFHMFNIKNPNQKAAEIGHSQLKSFMKAAGVKDFRLQNVLDLVGLRCLGNVKIRKQEGYEDQNVVTTFKPAPDGDAPSAPNANPSQPGTAATPF